MIIRFLVCGKSPKGYVEAGSKIYLDRLKHYCRVEWCAVDDRTKAKDPQLAKVEQGLKILQHVAREDHLVLFDENGVEYTSVQFASFISKKMNGGVRNLVFVIGGAYGFSDEVYARANEKFALSRLTYPHDLVRIIALEQLYRSFTIIRGEGYHHT